MTSQDIPTDYLVAQPSFASGVASIIDIFGSTRHYNNISSNDSTIDDAQAISSDWQVISQDLQKAINAHQE